MWGGGGLLTRADARPACASPGSGAFESNLLALDAALGGQRATATAAAAHAPPFTYPPLVEMVRRFRETLGMEGGTVPAVVDGTCAMLSVGTAGLSLTEKAQRCYAVLYRAAPRAAGS